MAPRLPLPSPGPWLGMWPLGGPPSPAVLEQPVTLKVSGGSAVRMRAMLLAECGCQPEDAPAWHEASLYRRDDGAIVLALRACRVLAGGTDLFRVECFAGPEQALRWVGHFDPLRDLPLDAPAWRSAGSLRQDWRQLSERLQSSLMRMA